MKVDISIIIPVYNSEKYIEYCVRSALNQTTKSIEIILVDDGSDDNSSMLCDLYSSNNYNVYAYHIKNQGPGVARNVGIEKSHGEFVAFLDSDDFLEPNYCEIMIEACKRYEADICVSNGSKQFVDAVECIENNYSKSITVFYKKDIQGVIARLIHGIGKPDDGISGSACFSIFRRGFLNEKKIRFHGDRLLIAEDSLFSLDAYYNAGCILMLDYIGYYYRYNPASLSRGYRPSRFDQLKNAMIILENKCEELSIDQSKERIALYFWDNYEKCINQEIRYVKRKDGIENLKKLTADGMANKYLCILKYNRSLSGMRALLCDLLFKQQVHFTYCLLFIYNNFVHRKK